MDVNAVLLGTLDPSKYRPDDQEPNAHLLTLAVDGQVRATAEQQLTQAAEADFVSLGPLL